MLGSFCCQVCCDREEVGLLRRSAKEDKQLDDHSFGRDDGEGGTVRLSLWNQPGEGIYGAFARCNRLVSVAEQLLHDEPYQLSLQNDHEGCQGWRRVDVASRLRLLVRKRTC